MKKNAIAIIAIAAVSSISLGFTYIGNYSADQKVKAAVTASSQKASLDNLPDLFNIPSSDRSNKSLSSWD